MAEQQNKGASAKGPAPLKTIDSDVVVGKDILELLSSSMYLDPVTIYREYVQNSADAIDQANGSIVGKVSIFIDQTFRTVRIRDNGIGVPGAEFIKRLPSFGASKKRGTSSRGFRGVGRLAGLGYCRELIFRSRARSESNTHELMWDCGALRGLIQSGEPIDLNTVVRRVVSHRTVPPNKDDHASFFEVELRGVVRHKNDQLINPTAISEYISQVAPVPFHPEFSFGSQIRERLRGHVRLGELDIRINHGDPIYRPFRNSFEAAGGSSDLFGEIEWIEIPTVDGQGMAAVGWFLHHSYHGALPNSTKVKGLRLRSGNIQVGEGNLLEELFVEPRFNAWSVGEIHVIDRRITPNGRRDHFEQNTHFANLLNNIAPAAREISRRCRLSSIERKWLRDFEMHERLAKERLAIIVQGGAPQATRNELLAEAKISLAKMAKVSGLDGLVFADRLELTQRYQALGDILDRVSDAEHGADPLGGLPEEKRAFYREMIRLIYKCSTNRVAAKALVDRILADAGLPPLSAETDKTLTTETMNDRSGKPPKKRSALRENL